MIKRPAFTGRKKYTLEDAPLQGADWKQNWTNVFGFAPSDTAAGAFAQQGTPLGPRDMSLPQTVAPSGKEWWQPTGGAWQLRDSYKPLDDTLPPIPDGLQPTPDRTTEPKPYGDDMRGLPITPIDPTPDWWKKSDFATTPNLNQTNLPPIPQFGVSQAQPASVPMSSGMGTEAMPGLNETALQTGNPLEDMFPQGTGLGMNYADLFGG